MKIICVGYRDWAINIYRRLQLSFKRHSFVMMLGEQSYSAEKIVEYSPDLVLFFGWSKHVSAEIVKTFDCLMLHPSPLPKYRGGSPLQNQIINGETVSAVSIFKLDDGLDTGPIAKQKKFSLKGGLQEIFERIEDIGFELTAEILTEGLHLVEQDHTISTTFPRRKPEQSEITIQEIQEKPAEYLYNKVRMLQSPYPCAFIKTADGKKMVLKCVEIID